MAIFFFQFVQWQLILTTPADLVVVGSAMEAYRLNLSEGRFLASLPLSAPAANAVRPYPRLRPAV